MTVYMDQLSHQKNLSCYCTRLDHSNTTVAALARLVLFHAVIPNHMPIIPTDPTTHHSHPTTHQSHQATHQSQIQPQLHASHTQPHTKQHQSHCDTNHTQLHVIQLNPVTVQVLLEMSTFSHTREHWPSHPRQLEKPASKSRSKSTICQKKSFLNIPSAVMFSELVFFSLSSSGKKSEQWCLRCNYPFIWLNVKH